MRLPQFLTQFLVAIGLMDPPKPQIKRDSATNTVAQAATAAARQRAAQTQRTAQPGPAKQGPTQAPQAPRTAAAAVPVTVQKAASVESTAQAEEPAHVPATVSSAARVFATVDTNFVSASAAAGKASAPLVSKGASISTGPVPPVDAPCWTALVGGHVVITTENLGLQMMLMRAKYRFERLDASKRGGIIDEVRSYFVKYANILPSELKALA